MEGYGLYTDFLLSGEDDGVAGMEDVTIPTTQNILSEVGVEMQPSRGTKGSKRTKNFNPKEDEVVCSGWLNISKDPIQGANQSRSTFWSRVHVYFEEHMKEHIKDQVPRTQSSVMHRWLTIQTVVNKFCSCYEAILRRNQSGSTIQNKVHNICSIIFLNLMYL
jgi:hypothetical protein